MSNAFNGRVLGADAIPSYTKANGIYRPTFIARQLSGLANGKRWPPSVQDPNFSSVVCLIHFDDLLLPNGDGSSYSLPNRGSVGDSGVGFGGRVSKAQTQFGEASMLISTFYTGGVAFNTNAAYSMGTGDFTMEFWTYITSLTPAANVWDFRSSGTSIAPMIGWSGPSTGTLQYFVNGANRITSASGALTANTWLHIAVARASSNTKMFMQGVQVGSTFADTNNYVSSGHTFGNSNTFNASVASAPPQAYFSEARLTKGVALYTTTFTPPTARFPDF